ncbi:MAG: 3-methyl-2-oxobutanoate dehydrogenase subunit VorB [Deltaproteobacteria bacterium]|nr:3-methyl-2-oxobutanoate dehydrogenase subunit VorB [Deltaproteobacteria bacterium]
MGEKKLLKGCEAIGEAAIQAGAKAFFGYPITPQSEVPEYLSKRLPEVGGVFLQAESEVAASNMLYGAAGAGVRIFTTTSSPGYSLMQEAVSYMAGSELPCVIVNIVRGGPGLGGILPGQGDYKQATRGGGHGDYRTPVLAPSTVQEAADLMIDAFDIADKYRNPVLVLGDGLIGQMMEPVEFKQRSTQVVEKPWATTGAKGRPPNIVNSLYLDAPTLERHNIKLKAKYDAIEKDERRWEEYGNTGKLDILLVAYGTVARVCKTAVDEMTKQGIRVGLFRPISLYPFPDAELRSAARQAKAILDIELSTGQMIDDVKAAVEGRVPVHYYGRVGGIVCTPEEVAFHAGRVIKGEQVYTIGEYAGLVTALTA